MSINALFWQSAKGTANVGASYKNQCVEAIRICRSLRSEGLLHPGDFRSHLILECACTALDSASRNDSKAESAFRVFCEAVDEICKMNEEAAKCIQNNMDSARTRDGNRANKHESILAKLSSRNTERSALSYAGTTHGSLVTFFVPPCEHTVPINEASLFHLNFHVEHVATLPELVFRFHRKHRQRWPDARPFQPLKFPHFYVKRELDNVYWKVVRPLDNSNMGTLAPEDIIWVYGDRLSGHYELVRGVRRNRIRSVSFAPTGSSLQRVYRDICGHLALERFLFSDVFSPWIESVAAMRDFKPWAHIWEDPCRPGQAIIADAPLADIAIVSMVAKEVVNRALEIAPSPAQAPFDGYLTETMFTLQRQTVPDELRMPGALPADPNEAALLALNPLTRIEWWDLKSLKPALTSFVAPVRGRFNWSRP